jgi:hypothetical protein
LFRESVRLLLQGLIDTMASKWIGAESVRAH